jgi:hypothetical protein
MLLLAVIEFYGEEAHLEYEKGSSSLLAIIRRDEILKST